MAGPKTSKASKAAKSSADVTVGSTVLLKIKGYPAWPGKVVDVQEVGSDVVKDKPQKGDYVCVRFYPKGDHSWGRRTDCKVLTAEDIKAYISEPHRKGSELLEAYRTAGDPTAWEAELEARKQTYEEEMEDVDELEEDDEDEVDTASGAKKRKKASAGAKETKGKKAKVEKKPKATTSKKGTKVKSNPNIESEEEAEPVKSKGTAKKAADDLDADSAKVKDWRHKLQRAFLGKAPPAEKDMPNCDQYFTTIEAYEDMTIEQLQASKIGKVMRKIQALDAIPRDEDFHFKERAKKLMDKWQSQLNKAGATEDAVPAPATNGTAEAKAEEPAAAPVEAKEDAAMEPPAAEEEKPAAAAESAPAATEEPAPAAAAEAAEEKKEDVEMKAPEADGEKDAVGEAEPTDAAAPAAAP